MDKRIRPMVTSPPNRVPFVWIRQADAAKTARFMIFADLQGDGHGLVRSEQTLRILFGQGSGSAGMVITKTAAHLQRCRWAYCVVWKRSNPAKAKKQKTRRLNYHPGRLYRLPGY